MMPRIKQKQTVAIIGLGFVGLTTAAVFASKGVRVIGVEVDSEKILSIKSGKPPFFEPRLEEMTRELVLSRAKKKLFAVTNDIFSAVRSSALIFVTVGTPALRDGAPNLSYVKQCSKQIGLALSDAGSYSTVIVRSTVPPGTTENVVGKIISRYSSRTVSKDYGLVFNPEFLREGSAVIDTVSPHILVIGSQDSRSKETVLSFYKHLYSKNMPHIIETSITTAELIKYANNTFLATKISFINTMANICSKIPSADVEDVAKAIGLDPRIGSQFLRAGPGYGGSCLPKDVSGLVDFCNTTLGYKPILLEAIQSVNQRQYLKVIEMIEDSLNGTVNHRKIAVLGLAFKKDTDDIRDSISLKLIQELKRRGAELRLHDPLALYNTKKYFVLGNRKDENNGTVRFYDDYLSCIKSTDCCVIMTEWEEYKGITSRIIKKHMKKANIIDTRRILRREDFQDVNFDAIGIGKKENSRAVP
jgi:UDPglucose 6-dehydrogenase